MATIPTIQLLRNSNIYSSRDAARSALEGQKGNVPDGGVILARYSGTTGEEQIIKTLAGFVSNISTPQNATVTIIDVEGASENVQTAITNAINKLNKADTEEVGQYVSSVSEENGIIRVTRTPLPSVEKSVMVGEAVTAVTQTNGKIGVEYGSINAVYVSVTDSMNRFDSDNVDGALNELYTSLNKGLGSLGAQIGALSTSSTVTLESVDETEGFLKVYTIKQGDREVGTINIPKDLVVTSGSVVKGTWNDGTFTEEESGSGTALKLVIANQTNPVYINTLDLVKDHIAGNGIAISNTNEISVKKDSTSEPFLTVGADGVKLSGVKTAIDAAIESLDATVKGESAHVDVTVEQSHGKITGVTVTTKEIASGNALLAEMDARQRADTALSNRLGDGVTSSSTATAQFAELSNKLGTGVSTAEGKTVTEQLQALSGRTGDASGVTSVEGAKKYTDDKLKTLGLTPVGGNGQVITTISQTDGKVSVTATTLGADNVTASTIASSNTTVAVTGTNVSAQIASLAKSIKNVDVSEQLANYYTKSYIDEHYWDIDTTGRYVDATMVEQLNKLDAEVESKIESETEITTTKAIKIVQTHGKIESITLGAFDCGTY